MPADEALRAAARRHAVVADLGQRALATLDPIAFAQESAARVATTLGVDLCDVVEPLSGGIELLMKAGVGWKPGVVGFARFPAGSGSLAGLALLGNQPVVSEDLRRETRVPPSPLLNDHGAACGAGVVIQGTRRPFGVLSVYARRPRAFETDELNFLQAVANLLGAAFERRQAEEALRRSEEQLRTAMKMEAIGRLAGGVAHDFNNVLTAILGYSELILSGLKEDDPMHAGVVEIRRAGLRAAALTRQLLAFSRRQDLQPRVINLNVIVADIERMLRRLIGEDVRLATSLDPGLGNVKADPGQIEQVLVNLVVNARDAMPSGGSITVLTGNVAGGGALPGGEWVALSVLDTGTGMDAETRAHLFEPFFTTKGVGKGTGLGLSTVYGIVQQSGGTIGVETEPGQGTRFTIHLPRTNEPLDAPAPAPLPAASSAASGTILVVEDADGLRRMLVDMLGRAGYSVLEACDGAEALSLCGLHESPIDLVLTDLMMPGMSGRDVVARLKRERPGLPVIYMSGYAGESSLRKEIDKEDGFLSKPFTPAALLAKVGAWIRRRVS